MLEKLKTDIPEIENDGMNCERRVTLAIKERQLWYIFIALERLEAIPEIETAVLQLADEIHKKGEMEWGWYPII